MDLSKPAPIFNKTKINPFPDYRDVEDPKAGDHGVCEALEV